MKLIFAATSSFALPTLAILQQHHAIAAVITNPDAKSGRGKKMRPSPVKEAAQKFGLAIYDAPIPDLYDAIRSIAPDLLIVAAYGAIIPGDILAIPRSGALNIHPSLLPKYRGASPIQAAILNGDKETGVTIIQLTDKLDAGPIVAKIKIALSENITAGDLHDALAKIGAKLLLKTLEKIPRFEGIAQDESQASYTKKITPSDATLNPQEPAFMLERKIRAYNPLPGAYIKTRDLRLKIFSAYIKKDVPQKIDEGASFIVIDKLPALVCGDGQLLIFTEVQPDGRKRMSGEEFVRGYVQNRAYLKNCFSPFI